MKNNFFKKINEVQKRIPELTKRLPGIAKVEGLRFIADNFKKEGFEEKPGSYKKWKKKKASGNKKVLVGEKRGGKLKRSWQQASKASGTKAEFTSELPYAAVHNEGLQAGKPPGFIMPQRQMIGESEALDQRIEKKFDELADKAFE